MWVQLAIGLLMTLVGAGVWPGISLTLSPCPVDRQVVMTEMMRLNSRAGLGLTRDHMEIRPG